METPRAAAPAAPGRQWHTRLNLDRLGLESAYESESGWIGASKWMARADELPTLWKPGPLLEPTSNQMLLQKDLIGRGEIGDLFARSISLTLEITDDPNEIRVLLDQPLVAAGRGRGETELTLDNPHPLMAVEILTPPGEWYMLEGAITGSDLYTQLVYLYSTGEALGAVSVW